MKRLLFWCGSADCAEVLVVGKSIEERKRERRRSSLNSGPAHLIDSLIDKDASKTDAAESVIEEEAAPESTCESCEETIEADASAQGNSDSEDCVPLAVVAELETSEVDAVNDALVSHTTLTIASPKRRSTASVQDETKNASAPKRTSRKKKTNE